MNEPVLINMFRCLFFYFIFFLTHQSLVSFYLFCFVLPDDFAERTFRSWPFLLRTTLAPLCAIALNRTYRATIRFKPIPFTPTEQGQWHYASTDSLTPWVRNPEWRVIETDWISWVVLNVDRPAADVFMAPGALVDDGSLYAHVLRKPMSLLRKLWIFTKLEDGSHILEDQVELFKLSEFVVYPHNASGHMVISGEELPVQSVHGKVQRQAASFVY